MTSYEPEYIDNTEEQSIDREADRTAPRWEPGSYRSGEPTMRGFIITADHIWHPGDSPSKPRCGHHATEWSNGKTLPEGPVVRFRLYDDDDNLYYEGFFGDAEDDFGDVQYDAVLNFGEWDAGCTTVKVLRGADVYGEGGEWKQEIG